MKTVKEIIARIESLANPEKVLFKKQKFGIESNNALGVMHSDLNAISREIGKNEELAKALFDTNIYEARVLCAKLFPPKKLTSELAEKWVVTFENWEVCDSFSMGVIAKSPLAKIKIEEWVMRESEFEKRAGFATMAAHCMADKNAENVVYENFLPLIINASNDERLYVKKAVNWALRSIGKRNIDLNKKAIQTAEKILDFESKSAQWIAKDAIRELSSGKANILDYPRRVYRPIM